MHASMARHLQTLASILGCVVLTCAGGALSPLRAQSAQNQTQRAPQSGAAPPTEAPAPSPSNAPELNMHDSPIALRTQVTVVPVRVVVRDQNGRAVGNLHREDFRLLEDGKPQDISNFTVETLAGLSQQVVGPNVTPPGGNASQAAAPFAPPSRFVVLLFDDIRLSLQDLMQVRNAASRYIDASLAPTDRVAIYTTSGQNQSDFTADRARLHKSLAELLPRTLGVIDPTAEDCPPMELYEADQIVNMNDDQAIAVATQDAITCLESPSDAAGVPDPTLPQRAQDFALAAARRVFELGDQQTEDDFRRLREVIQRMADLPGQRSIVLLSPGFIYPTHEWEFSEIIDDAIRRNIFIDTLDARGLYTPELGSGDISRPMNSINPQNSGFRTFYRITGEERQVEVLLELANNTGGSHFENNNDLEAGLREVASPPEAYYLLAFTPSDLKYDGHFHSLKVTLVPKGKFTIQARKGFYAPKHGATPEDTARQDLEDAVFSQEVQHGIPITLQTQFYKTDAMDAKLAVLTHVDLAHMRFNKADGRNLDDLTIVTALFDGNGNFITGTQKVVQMKLRDETLEQLSRTGMTIRTNFDVKPGDYAVRLVVRDSQTAMLSSENGAVEIPY
jgi:VWFA-related protein